MLDDTVDVSGAKHYLVFIATGLGAEKYQLLCGRFGLKSVNGKQLCDLTMQVLTELLTIGGMHAKSLSYDAAQENVCEYRGLAALRAQQAHTQSFTLPRMQRW